MEIITCDPSIYIMDYPNFPISLHQTRRRIKIECTLFFFFSRSTGLDLSIQQRFRWAHFRIDVEPIRNLLARHFLRRLVHSYGGQLPSTDDPVFKVVEWIVCVWQRLNDGLGKLGLPDVVFGPDLFFPCPLESQDDHTIYE